jgi:hypothetical protein
MLAVALGVLASIRLSQVCYAQTAPDGATTESADGLRLVAHDGLDARQTYQLVVHKQGDRWLLYAGHIRGTERDTQTGQTTANGTSVLDVTNPAHPQYLIHIPPTPAPWFKGDPADATGAQHQQVCDGAELPNGRRGSVYMLRNNGAIAHEILDVTDPLHARFVTDVVRTAPARDGRLRTHKNFWDCRTGEAYLVSSVAGWTGQVLQIFDLSNPEKPRHIRDFGLPGTQPGGDPTLDPGFALHEANVLADRVYLAYGTDHDGVIQILDRTKLIQGQPDVADPFAPTNDALTYPQIARLDMPHYWGGHTAKPIMNVTIPDYIRDKKGARRNFLFTTSEGIDFRCSVTRHVAFFVDITDERHPWPVSNFQVPALPTKPGDPDFCERGVFGPHSPHASHNPLYEGKLIFLSYFTGGVRVIDMRDPFKPMEVGHFMARATPASRVIYPPNAGPDVKPWPVANTVEIDERGGYVYMADRPNNGLFVLEITGKVKEIAEGH